MNYASTLRRELSTRAQIFAQSQKLPHCLSYGESPVVCFPPADGRHGNFIQSSYRAITSNADWRQRLAKAHAQGRTSLPQTDRGRWMELDSCSSSDALLMNVFCYPGVLRRRQTLDLLGVEPSAALCFGYKARVPLSSGRFDRTEVDLRLNKLLIEAKLTESDFQRADRRVLSNYRDFHDVFDVAQLPQTDHHYLSYQLLRNVLAAHALQCSFCVLLDARRPDLIQSWYAVMRCVKPIELRTKLKILTWQELARSLPSRLRAFLEDKYRISGSASSGAVTEHAEADW